jgi:signal transduction histidine kinase
MERRHGRLLDAVLAISAELDLHSVLRQIVHAAVDLVEARFGALGVLSQDGKGLDQLVHAGMDELTLRGLGELPRFCGLLGELIENGKPVRVADLAEHPRAIGFPPGHPPMRSFLGVPIRVGDVVYGNLYLTEKCGASEFTEGDEKVAVALAGAAAVAVQNARLFEQKRRDEIAMRAASEVTRLLLSGAEDGEVFTAIAEWVRRLCDAPDAAVILPTNDGMLRIVAGAGDVVSGMIGVVLDPAKTPSGAVYLSGVAANMSGDKVAEALQDRPELPRIGPSLLVPLAAGDHTRGVLTASRRPGADPFSSEALEVLRGFAEQAELACELADRRRDSEALSLFADRDRIARNLHDLVIQRLYATGMALEGAANVVTVDPEDGRRRIHRAVSDLDATIKEIRTTVFALQQPADKSSSLRAKIVEVVDEAAAALGFGPSVQFDGLIDTRVGEREAEQLLAVLREALSNVARHAQATAVSVAVSAQAELVLRVTDNGIGIAPGGRRSGLVNMQSRAGQLGGRLDVELADPGAARPGTVLRWAVPLT